MSDQNSRMHSEYSDSKADIVLVSEDNVRFRVHSYVLMYHRLVYLIARGSDTDVDSSGVLREMLNGKDLVVSSKSSSPPARPDIPLDTDADHLKIFLDYMSEGDTTPSPNIQQLTAMLDLSEKWECVRIPRMVGYSLLHIINNDPWSAFVMAARMKDENLIKTAIRSFTYIHRAPQREGDQARRLRFTPFENALSTMERMSAGMVVRPYEGHRPGAEVLDPKA